MYIKRQLDPNNLDDLPDAWVEEDESIFSNSDRQHQIQNSNVPDVGVLNSDSFTNPNSGRLHTTTPFPSITIFNDHRDRNLSRAMTDALPRLMQIIALYVSSISTSHKKLVD